MKGDWVKENQPRIIGAQNSEREVPSVVKARSKEQIGRPGKKREKNTNTKINKPRNPANDPYRQSLQKNTLPRPSNLTLDQYLARIKMEGL